MSPTEHSNAPVRERAARQGDAGTTAERTTDRPFEPASANAARTDERPPATGPTDGPDAAEPTPQPHVVLGTGALPEAYEADGIARREAEARRRGTHSSSTREADTGGQVGADGPDGHLSAPLRIGVAGLVVVVVVALVAYLL